MPKVSLDDDALNPTYGYVDDEGAKHSVWFLDAATFFNEVKVGDDYRPRGYALWRMGAEDPGVWSFFRQPYGTVKPAGLENIAPGTERRLRRPGRGAARQRDANGRLSARSRSIPTTD